MTLTVQPVRTIVTERAGEIEAPILVVKVPPWKQVLVRVARTFLQAFLGFALLLVVGSLTVDAANWARWLDSAYLLDLGRRVLVCAIVASAIALVSLGQNALELVLRLDATNPRLRG